MNNYKNYAEELTLNNFNKIIQNTLETKILMDLKNISQNEFGNKYCFDYLKNLLTNQHTYNTILFNNIVLNTQNKELIKLIGLLLNSLIKFRETFEFNFSKQNLSKEFDEFSLNLTNTIIQKLIKNYNC